MKKSDAKTDKKQVFLRLKISGIDLSKKKINYRKKDYSKKEWFANTGKYIGITDNNIYIKNNEKDIRTDILYHSFLLNVLESTKMGGFLSLFVFLLISLITFSSGVFLQINENFGFGSISASQTIFLIFIGLFFLFLSFVLFIKLVVKKQRLFLTVVNGQIRYKFVDAKTYTQIIEKFVAKIEKSFIFFHQIYGEKSSIREFNIFDEEKVLELYTNQWILERSNSKKMRNLDDARSYINSCIESYVISEPYKLAIINNEGLIIGFIGLAHLKNSTKRADISYGLDNNYWNQGIMSEVVALYCNYLENQGKEIIYAKAFEDNYASIKVLLNNGFVLYSNKGSRIATQKGFKFVNTYVRYTNKTEESNNNE